MTSRGCWRECAFCSINAWYERTGGKRFRYRSIGSIVAEMSELYIATAFASSTSRTITSSCPIRQGGGALRCCARRIGSEGVGQIAIAVKARPDSINHQSIRILDDLGLFRVFLGVENASENGLRNLNRKNTIEQILNALDILNSFDVHIAYNLLMFEPDTVMDEILVNLRFMERHNENPFNFCCAEAYPAPVWNANSCGKGACWEMPSVTTIASRTRVPRRSTRSPITRSSIATSATSVCTTSTCRWISTSNCCAAFTLRC